MEQNSSQRGGVISQYSVSNVNEYVENADNNPFPYETFKCILL